MGRETTKACPIDGVATQVSRRIGMDRPLSKNTQTRVVTSAVKPPSWIFSCGPGLDTTQVCLVEGPHIDVS